MHHTRFVDNIFSLHAYKKGLTTHFINYSPLTITPHHSYTYAAHDLRADGCLAPFVDRRVLSSSPRSASVRRTLAHLIKCTCNKEANSSSLQATIRAAASVA